MVPVKSDLSESEEDEWPESLVPDSDDAEVYRSAQPSELLGLQLERPWADFLERQER